MNRSKLLLSSPFLAFGLVASAGCFVVDDAGLESLTVVDVADSGTLPVADSCGGTGYIVSQNGDYLVDTVGASNDLNTSLCSGGTSPGPDVFLGIEASQGQYWHFHVSPAPGNTTTVDPIVSLFSVNSSDVCNTATCTYVTNRCSNDTEHFGVEIPSNSAGGTWALAIDNAMNTEATFRVAVYQPICGNAELEHGESCDPSVSGMESTCDAKCRRLITTTGPAGEPNDDRFWADHVSVAPGSPVIIRDFVDGKCDPDVLMLPVAMNQTFKVRAMVAGSTTVCRPFSEVDASFKVSLTTATGMTVAPFQIGSGADAGCAVATATLSSATEVFVSVEGAPATTGLQSYNLEFSLQ